MWGTKYVKVAMLMLILTSNWSGLLLLYYANSNVTDTYLLIHSCFSTNFIARCFEKVYWSEPIMYMMGTNDLCIYWSIIVLQNNFVFYRLLHLLILWGHGVPTRIVFGHLLSIGCLMRLLGLSWGHFVLTR